MAESMILRLTWSAGMSGATERMRATAPVTWGAAIDVPLSSPYSRPGSVLRMSFPGAAMWTDVGPKLENEAF